MISSVFVSIILRGFNTKSNAWSNRLALVISRSSLSSIQHFCVSSGFLGLGGSFCLKSRLFEVSLSLFSYRLLNMLLSASLSLGNTHGLVENLLELRLVVTRVRIDVMSLQVVLQIQSLRVSISVGMESWLAEVRSH